MIAGGGERKTLRLVAQYADACNIMDSPKVAAHKFAVLEKHCQAVGRDYNTINRTVTALAVIADTDETAREVIPPNLGFAYPGDVADYGLIGTVQTVEKRIAAFEAAGVQELIVNFADPTGVEQVQQFAELFLPAPGTPSRVGVASAHPRQSQSDWQTAPTMSASSPSQ
jgi:alkanesulfonate monooxygenase SsuD/methylene tetrahydromethanopterin reductase-like flavin-dependent oxidoreductase (luciferase family)